MRNPSPLMAFAASVLILVAVVWAVRSESASSHNALRTADGQRYNNLLPSQQGALAQCVVCHRIVADGPESSAPALWGIVGAATARSSWFGYSNALASKHGTWSASEIDAYLTDPERYLPGTRKTLSRVRDAAERKKIIDALQQLAP